MHPVKLHLFSLVVTVAVWSAEKCLFFLENLKAAFDSEE